MSSESFLFNKYGNKLLDAPTETELDAGKTVSKKVVHKTAEATGQLKENKTAENIVKPKPLPAENSRNVEEVHQTKGKKYEKNSDRYYKIEVKLFCPHSLRNSEGSAF